MANKYDYKKNRNEFTREMLSDTLNYQKRYGFDIGTDNLAHNNEADAFRHAYMQSFLAQRYGNLRAKGVSKLHEILGNINGQAPREANMDMWNNQQGQEIYEEICKEYPLFSELPKNRQKDIIAQKVVQRMRAGKLITGLNDSRKFQGYTNPLTGNNRIFTREDVRNMTPAEFSKFEKEIDAQLKVFKGSMPTNSDLEREATTGGGVVYVNPYTRQDDTYVKGYYRSKPSY